MIAQRWIRRGKLAIVAGTLGIGLFAGGCGPSGGPSSVPAEKKEDAEKREKMIKDIYQSRKNSPTKRGS